MPASKDDSSLRKLIENPPITSNEIVPLTKQQLDSAFRLHVGPVSELFKSDFYRLLLEHFFVFRFLNSTVS